MKIIVCGAGPVGTGIARQLSYEGNEVTVIDNKEDNLQKIRNTLDVNVVNGMPSHPPVLENGGAEHAEMIIAVTTSDELNMVVCQVAHTVFNVDIKIARVRHQNYLYPVWQNLYGTNHLPIDHIISPEKEVANAIVNRLHVPGALNTFPLVEGKLRIIEVRCSGGFSMINKTVGDAERDVGVPLSILAVYRDQKIFSCGEETVLKEGDEIFFAVKEDNVASAMKSLGYSQHEARNILIVGGGNIGVNVAQTLEKEREDFNVKIIELGQERCKHVVNSLDDTLVINGNALDREILYEAGIESTESVIAVTNDDEVNILSSILGKQLGAKTSLTLVNRSLSYEPIIKTLGIDISINPRDMTVSKILQHTRKGKVRAAFSVCGGVAEIVEAEVGSTSDMVGRALGDVSVPKGIKVGMIVRGDDVMLPDEKTQIYENDILIILAETTTLKKLDRMLASNFSYF